MSDFLFGSSGQEVDTDAVGVVLPDGRLCSLAYWYSEAEPFPSNAEMTNSIQLNVSFLVDTQRLNPKLAGHDNKICNAINSLRNYCDKGQYCFKSLFLYDFQW